MNSLTIQNPKDTITQISNLLLKLLDIYQKNLMDLIPTDILQSNHSYKLILDAFTKQKENPEKLMKFQDSFLKAYMNTFNLSRHHFEEPKSDKRFTYPAWKENTYFEFLEKVYHLFSTYIVKFIRTMEGLDRKTKQQLHFYIKNFIDFLAPTNYLWSNPEVIELTLASRGENLINGFKNYLEDLVLNNGRLNVRMTDLKAFKVGKNLAVTPGKIVYQNDIMQLIQYTPTTTKVYTPPILFVPPWINKYYILDLSPENSLVKWLVDQGFTVYMISWVNPDANLAHKTFDDYMLEGPLEALDIITKTAGCNSIHTVGYCVGGTLLACTLAYLKKKQDKRVISATFFMTLLNFSNPGELGVFIDDSQIDALEKIMQRKGYLSGRILDLAFNLLRSNDLIWPYFINNYLLGKPTKPFDILYWNADSANLPYQMYAFYLRNMYLYNRLKKPNEIELNGVKINLKEIDIPLFFLASETDHITLWQSVYSGLSIFKNCPVDFVLSESGHVRGVINPPHQNKYGFRIEKTFGKQEVFPKHPKEWVEKSTQCSGSWWPYWSEWLKKHDASRVAARLPNLPHTHLEDAPGSYVLTRL